MGERDDLKLRAYPTESILAAQRTAIFDRNNPFHQLDVRKECGFDDCVTMEQFFTRASEIIGRQPKLHGLPSDSSRAVLSMLLIGCIFEFGLPVPNDDAPGCISDSVRELEGANYLIRFEDYQHAMFACCLDFSILLIELLRHQNIPGELRISKGHALVGISLGESGSLLLDPACGLAAHGLDTRAQAAGQLEIYRFPMQDHSRKVALQFPIMFG